ncbi:hypothetical protein BZZ08_03450 [Streptomyces sp. MH60]|nr:hypothetical protein BZZ08_03450 [Streptomyces sp. MH60]
MSACGVSKALPDDAKPPPDAEQADVWEGVTVVCDVPAHDEPAEAVVHCGPIVVDGVFRGVHYWGPGFTPPYI